MKKRIAIISLFASLLSLSGCVAASDDEATEDDAVAEATSALNGGPWTWVNTATSRCLDSNSSGGVYTLGCNRGSYQLWRNTPSTYGDTIINAQTGLCLDSNPSGSAYTLACNGGSFQQWTVTYKGTYGWEIRNVATGLCLDSNPGGSVYALGCNNGNFQRWN
ncbi:ricin-type beta-trefoil lectin domain protein [Sorangium sp. So ce321]|uniref:RICIN domain-containing protein n=1 Tax=Sorangium sp. So ce321 TaxID=3133300 RepID=UPI003F60FFDB